MKAQIVSFHCILKNKMGHVLSSTFNQDVITGTVDEGAPLKALALGLRNLKKGERRKIFLTAEEAYGFYDQELVIEVPRSKLNRQGHLHVGGEVRIEEGESSHLYRIVGLNHDTVTLDGNHPLAGQDLEFDIEATTARAATKDDLGETEVLESGRWLH